MDEICISYRYLSPLQATIIGSLATSTIVAVVAFTGRLVYPERPPRIAYPSMVPVWFPRTTTLRQSALPSGA